MFPCVSPVTPGTCRLGKLPVERVVSAGPPESVVANLARRVASSIWQSRGLLSPRFRVQVPGDPLARLEKAPRINRGFLHGTISTTSRAWRKWKTRQV